MAAAVTVMFLGCQNKGKTESVLSQQQDSLQRIINQKDTQINDMVGTLNEIDEGFRQISEAENRVTIAQSGEGADKRQQIKENMIFISRQMQRNRALIAKLQNQLKNSSIKGERLRQTIENLQKQMEEKDQQMQTFREQLDAKDIHISELDESINNLNTSVSNLAQESSRKSEVISNQDQQLNTAWYVFGTSKELKEQGILQNGKVLQGNFNKNYFTKIDIRNLRQIKLYSKSAKLMTTHPSSSYSLSKGSDGQYVLAITNPQIFWSTSKYLVVLVR